MPDASRPPVPQPPESTLTAVLADLQAGGRLPDDARAAFAAGVLAWLRALAEPRLGSAWCAAHLPDARATSAPVTVLAPFDLVDAYAALQDRRVAFASDGPKLLERPFARRQAGAFYTPPELVALVLDEARVERASVARAGSVLDPACGAGAFLLAALARLAPDPADRPAAARRLHGIDRDPLAVAAARVALALAATPAGGTPPDLTGTLVCADALLGDGLDWDAFAPEGGFDAIVGNPPWERVKLQQVEWLAAADPAFRAASAADRKTRLAALAAAGDPLWHAFTAERDRRAAQAARLRAAYPEIGGGDTNLYAAFAALAARAVAPGRRAALLVPSGIASDRHTCGFVAGLARAGRLAALLDFENRARLFPNVDGRFRFACLTLTGPEVPVMRTRLAFGLRRAGELERAGRALALSPRALSVLNPNSGGLPLFRTRADAALALRLHRRLPPLVDRRADPPRRAFAVRYRRMLDMTNHAHRFRPAAEAGAGDLPLYEGKMVQAYDHRAASVDQRAGNLKRPGQPRRASEAERADPHWRPRPRFVVAAGDAGWPDGLDWAVALKHVTSPTNARGVIAAVVPRCAAGNSLPLLLPDGDSAAAGARYRREAPLLLANLNALVLDWLARGKLQGQNLNLYILEQLPVVPPARIPDAEASAIRADVLALTYTAHDLTAFARDQGHEGPPFPFEPRARAEARARLDARIARLYGLGRRALARVLDGFPQLARREAREGACDTRALTLAAFDRLWTGDGAGAHPKDVRHDTFG